MYGVLTGGLSDMTTDYETKTASLKSKRVLQDEALATSVKEAEKMATAKKMWLSKQADLEAENARHPPAVASM